MRKIIAFSSFAILFTGLAASSAVAGTFSFSSPGPNSAHQVAPDVLFTTSGALQNTPICTLDRSNVVVVTSRPCTQAPFSGFYVDQGGDVYNWTVSVASSFTIDAEYDIRVETDFVTPPEGDQTLTFNRDTTAPAVNVNTIVSPTNNNTPTIGFSATDASSLQFACVFSAPFQQSDLVTGYAPCESPSQHTPASPLADGPRALYVRATDAAGMVGYGAFGFIVDIVAPAITVASPQPNQVLQSSVPELSIGASDPDPGTGVSSLLCKYDAEAFAACNDAAFIAKNLPHGPHTLTVQATDGASNVSTLAVPFSVDTSLDDIPTPTVPASVKAKKLGGKVKGSKYRLKIQGSFAVPAGFDPAVACKGTVRFSITGKLKGKKSKTFVKNAAMKPVGRTCVYSATFSIPKAYKGKRLVTRTVFKGNALFGGFSKTAVIRKA